MTAFPDKDTSDHHGHVVHLYGQDDRTLVSHVTRYLVQGLQRGDGIVVVATPDHAEQFAAALREESCYTRAVLQGRVAWLDAQQTLDRFSVNGEPHWSRFLVVVGDVLRDVQERGGGHAGVRAYGEMVGLLWAKRQRASAARLEDYWNRLLEVTGCDLFCAYPVDIFGPDFSAESLDTILCQHTQVVALSDHLEVAVNRAIEDVTGAPVRGIREMASLQCKREWADIPPAQRLVLWVRSHFQAQADEILARARAHYLAAS